MAKTHYKALLTAAVMSFSLATSCFADDSQEEVLIKIDVSPSEVCTPDICLEVYSWTITALEDGIVVNNFIFNRNRCKINTPKVGREEGRKMDYSDTWSFNSSTDAVYRKCKPLEARVETNKGSWNFNFK